MFHCFLTNKIDAMDILHSQKVDGFCIVSSDSDFTRLAIRLRESGMLVSKTDSIDKIFEEAL